MFIREKALYLPQWTIRRYASDTDYRVGRPYDVTRWKGNVLLNEGITALQNLLTGAAETAFNNGNANLGVGDGAPSALTGTLTFTNASATVTGTGTDFTGEITAGDWIQLDADGVIYQVDTVTNDTNLTLTGAYNEAGGAGAASVVTRALATQTGLLAASPAYTGMEATYPQIAAQTTTWRSVFGSGVANFAWREFTVASGNSNAADNLNRTVQYQGVKASGQTWTLDLQVTWS